MSALSKITNVPLIAVILLIGFYNSSYASGGKEVFENTCRNCHGENLHGDMPGVPDLVINRAWTQKLDAQIHKFVKQGSTASGKEIIMPAKGGNPNLTDDDIKSAVQYMRDKIKNGFNNR